MTTCQRGALERLRCGGTGWRIRRREGMGAVALERSVGVFVREAQSGGGRWRLSGTLRYSLRRKMRDCCVAPCLWKDHAMRQLTWCFRWFSWQGCEGEREVQEQVRKKFVGASSCVLIRGRSCSQGGWKCDRRARTWTTREFLLMKDDSSNLMETARLVSHGGGQVLLRSASCCEKTEATSAFWSVQVTVVSVSRV